jgi:hypothetical protein
MFVLFGEQLTYSVLCCEGNFQESIFEKFCDKFCLFTDISELGPFGLRRVLLYFVSRCSGFV